jgi:hypothetical protein
MIILKIRNFLLFIGLLVASNSFGQKTENKKTTIVCGGGIVNNIQNICHICAIGQFAVSSFNTGYFSGFIGYLDDTDSLSCLTGSININEIGNYIKVYPNPTSGKFFILPDENNHVAIVRIYDYLGKIVFIYESESFIQNSLLEFDLSGKSKGIYQVEILLDDNTRLLNKVALI